MAETTRPEANGQTARASNKAKDERRGDLQKEMPAEEEYRYLKKNYQRLRYFLIWTLSAAL